MSDSTPKIRCTHQDCRHSVWARGLCNTHYTTLRKKGILPLLPHRTKEELFWAKVLKTESCWLWQGAVDGTGYGSFRYQKGKTVTAHRFAYTITHGPIPRGYLVAHDCPDGDNKRCVRHLMLLTTTEHGRDRAKKRQNAWGDQSGARRHPEQIARGEEHFYAVLTACQVLDIRSRYAAGGITQIQLARECHVVPSTISKIVLRQRWKHI